MRFSQEATFRSQYYKIAFWVLAAGLVVVAWQIITPFIQAILWASVLCVLVQPIHKRFSKRLNANFSAVATVLFTLLVAVIPLSLVGLMLYAQIATVVGELQGNASSGQSGLSPEAIVSRIQEGIRPLLESLGTKFDLNHWFAENREHLVNDLSGPLRKAVFGFGTTVFTMVVALLTLFFLLRDGHRLQQPVLDLIPLPPERTSAILIRVRDTIHAVFVSVFLVALMQGALAGILYWITGVPTPLIWTVATTILCIIPLLGAPIIYIPLGLLLFSEGKNWQAIVLLAGGFGIVSQIDNLLKPWVIGSRVPLHPMAIFFALLGGVFVLGPIGIMAGPIVLTLLIALVEIIRESSWLPTVDSNHD